MLVLTTDSVKRFGMLMGTAAEWVTQEVKNPRSRFRDVAGSGIIKH